jgi:hypothetical protein
MRFAVKGRDIDIKIRENEGLPFEVAGCNR